MNQKSLIKIELFMIKIAPVSEPMRVIPSEEKSDCLNDVIGP